MSTFPAEVPGAAPAADVPVQPQRKSRKRRVRRRVAKALAWFSLAVTAAFVLAEPWLLLPVITFVVALSLWD
jgi:peptidoglycan biosynthesis protein MviN/MurJ (putative lipid II flippase)